MDAENLPVFGINIDKSQVRPIHQKRILTFVNHFITNTVTFLNKFVVNSEMKFIEFERKLHKIESSLKIVEEKLASLPNFDSIKDSTKSTQPETKLEDSHENTLVNNETDKEYNNNNNNTENINEINESVSEVVIGVKACEDERYKKYFKMLQFGVPAPAVKLKMTSEGIDSNILDTPDKIFEDGIKEVTSTED